MVRNMWKLRRRSTTDRCPLSKGTTSWGNAVHWASELPLAESSRCICDPWLGSKLVSRIREANECMLDRVGLQRLGTGDGKAFFKRCRALTCFAVLRQWADQERLWVTIKSRFICSNTGSNVFPSIVWTFCWLKLSICKTEDSGLIPGARRSRWGSAVILHLPS